MGNPERKEPTDRGALSGIVYFDHHATTPCDPRVLEEMLPYFSERFGNAASRSHRVGWEANEAVERARERVARSIGAKAREIVFTSGATEANNLALKGVVEKAGEGPAHVVAAATEHKSVLDPLHYLESRGADVTLLPVDGEGFLDPEDVARAMRPETVLVSVMTANNEIGVLQPVAEIAKVSHRGGALFHTDAVQAMGKLPVEVGATGADLLSLSAHKIYGPKGVGALFVRRGVPLAAQIHGGGHEEGRRSGTLPVPLIVGFGAAAERAAEEARGGEPARLAGLRDRLLAGIRAGVPDCVVNGGLDRRLPNNLNLSFPGVPGESLIVGLKGLAVSSGSACTSASPEPSHVLKALGVSPELAHSSIRFGLGRGTTEAEVDFAIRRVTETVSRLKELYPG